jgi:hypothetical protein
MFNKKKIMTKKENLFKIGDLVRHKTEKYGNEMLVTAVGQMTSLEGTQFICTVSYSRIGQMTKSIICEDEIYLVIDKENKK